MWKPIETAPIDGRELTVREADGSWGKARVLTERTFPIHKRFKHVWVWSNRTGKAYPVEWLENE